MDLVGAWDIIHLGSLWVVVFNSLGITEKFEGGPLVSA
jgi:hypothetical protein